MERFKIITGYHDSGGGCNRQCQSDTAGRRRGMVQSIRQPALCCWRSAADWAAVKQVRRKSPRLPAAGKVGYPHGGPNLAGRRPPRGGASAPVLSFLFRAGSSAQRQDDCLSLHQHRGLSFSGQPCGGNCHRHHSGISQRGPDLGTGFVCLL